MLTPLEVVTHCLNESQKLVSSVLTILQIAEFDTGEADEELFNSVVTVSVVALKESMVFHQTARKITQDLIQMEKK